MENFDTCIDCTMDCSKLETFRFTYEDENGKDKYLLAKYSVDNVESAPKDEAYPESHLSGGYEKECRAYLCQPIPEDLKEIFMDEFLAEVKKEYREIEEIII